MADETTVAPTETVTPPADNGALPEYVKELRQEAAARRVENKELKAKLATLESQLTGITPAAPPAAPAAPAKPPQSGDDLAAVISELRAANKELAEKVSKYDEDIKQTRKEAKQKMLRASLTRMLTEAKVLDVDSAVTLLEARGARLTDEDRVVLDVRDDSGEASMVSLNGDALKKYKILTDHWFPPVGVGGSGSAAPRMAPAGVDLERAKRDPNYLAAHEKEIAAHLRGNAR